MLCTSILRKSFVFSILKKTLKTTEDMYLLTYNLLLLEYSLSKMEQDKKTTTYIKNMPDKNVDKLIKVRVRELH